MQFKQQAYNKIDNLLQEFDLGDITDTLNSGVEKVNDWWESKTGNPLMQSQFDKTVNAPDFSNKMNAMNEMEPAKKEFYKYVGDNNLSGSDEDLRHFGQQNPTAFKNINSGMTKYNGGH
jgi:hypothetical protein